MGTTPRPWSGRPIAWLLSGKARPVRFVLIGGLTAAVQLAILGLLAPAGWHPLLANASAFMASAQLNFALSQLFTWHDRRAGLRSAALARRWLAFHGSIAGTTVLNLVVFALARSAVSDLVAACAGIGAAAVVNFVMHDRVTFRASQTDGAPAGERTTSWSMISPP